MIKRLGQNSPTSHSSEAGEDSPLPRPTIGGRASGGKNGKRVGEIETTSSRSPKKRSVEGWGDL